MLRGDGRSSRVGGPGEDGEQGVSLRSDFTAVVGGDGGAEEFVVGLKEFGPTIVAQLSHKTGGSLDIGKEKRHDPAGKIEHRRL
jgi:hypothetical protein